MSWNPNIREEHTRSVHHVRKKDDDVSNFTSKIAANSKPSVASIGSNNIYNENIQGYIILANLSARMKIRDTFPDTLETL